MSENQRSPSAGTERVLTDIADERSNQRAYGYDDSHDDQYDKHQLELAAASYALYSSVPMASKNLWPWEQRFYNPGTDDRRRLVKAAALIVARIEAIDRGVG